MTFSNSFYNILLILYNCVHIKELTFVKSSFGRCIASVSIEHPFISLRAEDSKSKADGVEL
jgi:hypothetical protein